MNTRWPTPCTTFSDNTASHSHRPPMPPLPLSPVALKAPFGQQTLGKAITNLRKIPKAQDVVQPLSHKPQVHSETADDDVQNLSIQDRIKRMNTKGTVPVKQGGAPPKPIRVKSSSFEIPTSPVEEGNLGWSAAGMLTQISI